MKIQKKNSVSLFPCPVVLVTTTDVHGRPNIITLSWVGVVCSDPPMIGIAIRPERYSYRLIQETGEFVVNIQTIEILEQADFCGTVSGRNVDKFLATGLTPEPAVKVKPPLIKECPVNLECKVRKIIPLGTHHLFLGEVALSHVDSNILDEKGAIDYEKISSTVYLYQGHMRGEYWNLEKKIGVYGFSKFHQAR